MHQPMKSCSNKFEDQTIFLKYENQLLSDDKFSHVDKIGAVPFKKGS